MSTLKKENPTLTNVNKIVHYPRQQITRAIIDQKSSELANVSVKVFAKLWIDQRLFLFENNVPLKLNKHKPDLVVVIENITKPCREGGE